MKIGIDLGGSHISVGIITENGKILKKQEKVISFIEEIDIKQKIRDSILSLINQLLRELQIPIFIIEEIGIGVPGIIKENYIIKCEKFGIYNWNLAKELEQYYKIPVKINNDALCAAKAECKYGNLNNVNKAVFLCLGTGIGGATILQNNIFPSEFGHMIINKDGKECHCGKKGCFEKYSSMKVFKDGMIELLELNKNTTSEELLNILKKEKQNRELNKYIDEYTNNFLIGISNIINIINPEVICIGGSFVYFEDILYKRLLEKANLLTFQFEKPKFVLAKLQNDAGIIGSTLFDKNDKIC